MKRLHSHHESETPISTGPKTGGLTLPLQSALERIEKHKELFGRLAEHMEGLTRESKNYAELKSTLQPGDLVLFSGNGMMSSLILLEEQSPWSHIGIVIHGENDSMPVLLESTTLRVSGGMHKSGVAIHRLSDRIKRYDGTIAIRRLETQRTPEMLTSLGKYVDAVLVMTRTGFTDADLVGHAYEAMGLLPHSNMMRSYSHCDFSSFEGKGLHLQNGAALSEEIVLENRPDL